MKPVVVAVLAVMLTVVLVTGCIILMDRLGYRGLLNIAWMVGIPIGLAATSYRSTRSRIVSGTILLLVSLLTVGLVGQFLRGDAPHTSSVSRP